MNHHNMEPDERTEIDPAEYFNPDNAGPPPSFLRKAWFPTVLAGVGVSLACVLNLHNRKPAFSGLQQHAIFSGLGTIFGFTGGNWLDRRAAQRDAVLYHYIVSHPEDFPPVERKKYADVLKKWVPIR
ncbi:NADH dehydrogenase [ubiquinone] 1 subunit C2-like [Homarus americanus]|uniref:NADH dehydrogenase [ubiquinone] 1 subunit C2-like n=1 Tax=Homarus americanus TaxID=6706 RepID=UPI001C45ECE4|nr:NADH dehydrogenase [ubiquinone] 1 subunit C2-like [Homarus americanus]